MTRSICIAGIFCMLLPCLTFLGLLAVDQNDGKIADVDSSACAISRCMLTVEAGEGQSIKVSKNVSPRLVFVPRNTFLLSIVG